MAMVSSLHFHRVFTRSNTDACHSSLGNLKYKPHLVQDLRHVIIPSIAKQIGYIPIPRAEYQDKQFDIVIENLTLEMANLLPK